jgi:DNA-binding NarL/FixJ family response regulator
VRILVADDFAPYRLGLERAVAAHPDLVLAASCADGGEALDALYATRPDCALLDVRMPCLQGTDIVRIAACVIETTFVLMSSDDDVQRDALGAGAALGLDKALPRRALLDRVVAVTRVTARTARVGTRTATG